ncbi:hypothetical protein WA171_003321 [Blastocystis sp. BT1]
MSKVYRCGFLGKDVGKTMSNTKKMVKWGLLIDDKRVVITIKHSILSHKKVIWYNDEIVKETKQFLTGDFDYAWSKDKHIFKIVITKDAEGYAYSLFIDDINFFDLVNFKEKDRVETEDIISRLKNGPIISQKEEEEEEESEGGAEVVEEEEEEVEDDEDQEFFSTSGTQTKEDDDNWLDFSSIEVTRTSAPEKSDEEEIRKRREKYTAGLVDLDFGL